MRKAFTLPELLIAVTLSAILMTAMLVFLSSGVGNAWKLKKQASSSVSTSVFEDRVGEVASMSAASIVHSGSYAGYGSGILLLQSGSNLPLSFFATKDFSGYCDSSTGAVNADGKIYKLYLGQAESPYFSGATGNFSLSGNLVMSGSEILVGKDRDYSEDDLVSPAGTDPLQVSLLHPRALLDTSDGLLIADTGKSRVLSYSGGKIYPLFSSDREFLHPSILSENAGILTIRGTTSAFTLQESPACTAALPDFHASFSLPDSFDTVILQGNAGVSLPSGTGAYVFDGNSPSGTGSSGMGDMTLSFDSPISPASLDISGLSLPSLPSGSYYLSFEFLKAGVFVKTIRFPLITCGDNSILSMTGNILGSSVSPEYSDTTGTPYDFNAFSGGIAWSQTSLSPFPISDFAWTTDANMLTLSFLEYTNYDCTLENHERRERIIKIPLK